MKANQKRCKISRRYATNGIRRREIELNSNVRNVFVGNADVLTDAADTPPVPRVMLTAD